MIQPNPTRAPAYAHGHDEQASACSGTASGVSAGSVDARRDHPCPSTSYISTPDPTAALRQARVEALKQQISREAVMAVLPQLVLDTMFERTNALTRAVHDLMAQPPEDRWALDGMVHLQPYRDLVRSRPSSGWRVAWLMSRPLTPESTARSAALCVRLGE